MTGVPTYILSCSVPPCYFTCDSFPLWFCPSAQRSHFRIYLAKAPKKPLALARVRCVAFAQKNKTKDFDGMNRWLRAKYQSNGTHVADWIILPRA